ALLIPRSTALRRRPLWQQRLRASDLLEAFRAEPDFPLVVEALRELWHEALDVPGLRSVLEDVKAGRGRREVVERPAPPPCAARPCGSSGSGRATSWRPSAPSPTSPWWWRLCGSSGTRRWTCPASGASWRM